MKYLRNTYDVIVMFYRLLAEIVTTKKPLTRKEFRSLFKHKSPTVSDEAIAREERRASNRDSLPDDSSISDGRPK